MTVKFKKKDLRFNRHQYRIIANGQDVGWIQEHVERSITNWIVTVRNIEGTYQDLVPYLKDAKQYAIEHLS